MARENKRPEIRTPEARAAFVWVFKAKQTDRGPIYTTALIFPGGTDLTALRADAKAAALETFGSADRIREMIAAGTFKDPFKPGAKLAEKYEGFTPDSTYIEPWSKFPPEVVHRTAAGLVPVTDERDLFSGCWVRAMVRAFGYDNKTKGVGFSLGNILVVRKDKALGGRAPAEAQFKDIQGPVIEAAAPTGPAPPMAAAADDFLS